MLRRTAKHVMPRLGPVLVAVAISSAAANVASAQSGSDAAAPPLRVIVACAPGVCDLETLKRNIPFIEYADEGSDADVRVEITRNGISPQEEFRLALAGLRAFTGRTDAVSYVPAAGESQQDTIVGMARMLRLALAPYLAATPLVDRVRVAYDPSARARGIATSATDDPWNFWVLSTRFRAASSGESARSTINLTANVDADRTTEDWKIRMSSRGNYRRGRFELTPNRTFVSLRRDAGADALIVRSFGEHWAAGARATGFTSTFLNQKLGLRFAPAVEFNVFPYAESTSRQLAFQYTVGVDRLRYYKETVFGRTEETLSDHALVVSLDATRPWGTLSGGIEAAQLLSDLDRRRGVFFGEASVRLFRGFSVDLAGSASILTDQIFLPVAEATTEEILVRSRQLETDYQYSLSLGFRFVFGSSRNPIANPRFTGSPGGFALF